MTTLDRMVHEPARLELLVLLARNEPARLSFSEVRDRLATSDGNLSVHARKLEEAGYLVARKGFVGRSPRTEYRITAAGLDALSAYKAAMDELLAEVRP